MNFKEDKVAREAYEYIHNTAEIGFEEINTAKYLANKLRDFGYEVIENIGTTGVLGILDSGKEGLCFGLRADMDALPFEVDGKKIAAHACGHDANCSMTLSVAQKIAEKGIKSGKFVVIFQQAEELTGALQMIDDYDFTFIDELVGVHLRPMAEGKLGEATHSLCHSASKTIEVTIGGLIAHGARPHLGINAIEIAVAIINSVNAIKIDPTVPHSVKVTQIKSIGNPSNSIPDKVQMAFNLRATTNETMEVLADKVNNIITKTIDMYSGTVLSLTDSGVIAADYDEDLTEICKEAVIDVLGNTLGVMPTVGGEDFHYFKSICGIKTAYVGIGADLTPGLHDINMTFDIKALDIGAEILWKIAQKRLTLK